MANKFLFFLLQPEIPYNIVMPACFLLLLVVFRKKIFFFSIIFILGNICVFIPYFFESKDSELLFLYNYPEENFKEKSLLEYKKILVLRNKSMWQKIIIPLELKGWIKNG